MHRVVAPFVVPMVASHVEAANVVGLHSVASGDVAAGTVSSGFDAVYVVAFGVVEDWVGGKTSVVWNGADQNGQRLDREGASQSEAGETRLYKTSSSRGGTGKDRSWQEKANGMGRGRTTDAGGV